MKKYIAFSVIIILVLAGLSFAYFASKQNGKTSEKSTKEQITELYSQKYNQPVDIEVLTNTGTFAKGIYNEPTSGGGIWFAAKTAKGWELAFAGNGIVPCDEINKYNFPKDMIPQCIDSQNGNQLIQR